MAAVGVARLPHPRPGRAAAVGPRLLKAKFHYASWFEAGRRPAAS